MAADFEGMIDTEEKRQNLLRNVPEFVLLEQSDPHYSITGRYVHRRYKLSVIMQDHSPETVLEETEKQILTGRIVTYGDDPFIVGFDFQEVEDHLEIDLWIAGVLY